MTVAGVELAAAMLRRRGAAVTLERRSGDRVEAGAALLAGEGDAVSAVAEAREAIEAGFDMVQLEKVPIAAVAEVAALARGRAFPPLIAAAVG